MTKLYAVRRISDGFYYNPDKSGNRKDPTFSKTPRLYKCKTYANKAKEFCKSGINSHWVPARMFTPVLDVEVVTFEVSRA